MKKVTTLFLGFVLLAAAMLPATWAIAQQPLVTASNLTEMIKNAKTPAEHEAIAAFYDKEAAANEEMAKIHRDDANIYAKPGMTLHCNNLARDFRRAAKEDKALAAAHREMAKKAAENTGQ
jgi:hypothetical protein